MEIPWQSIQGFSGASVIGALVLVDLGLIANAFADNLFPTITNFSTTAAYALVIAVPVLSLTYLLGLLCIGAAELALTLSHLLNAKTLAEDTVTVSARGESCAARFHQLRQEAELLAGGVIVFALLAVGSALSAWRIEGWRRFLTAVAIAAVIFAVSSVFLCLYRYKSTHALASATKSD